jgi:hypothetical protein
VPVGKFLYLENMNLNEWNWFEERIATLVLMARLPIAIAIARACRERPTRPADALMLGAISFVTHFDNENGLVPDTPAPELRHRYRVIAILAADVAMLTGARSCQDLAQIWQDTKSEIFRDD